MSLSNNFPTIFPELNLDFANTGVLDPRITFTRASTATYYNQLGVLTSAAVDVPRFDYNPSTLAPLGLLIEEARTNLLLQSEDFSTTWAATGATVTTNATTAPSGSATADKLVAGSGITVSPSSVSAFVRQDITKAATATTYTFSVFAKAGEFNAVRFLARDDATSANNAAVTVLLTDGTVLTAAAAAGTFTNASVAITNAGNGWYRVALTFTSSTETAIRLIYAVGDSSSTTGDASKGIYIWGAQLEAGAFATSYIPTTTTSLTRSADVASMTGTNFSSWYNAAEGTIYADVQTVDLSSVKGIYSIGDASLAFANRTRIDITFASGNSGRATTAVNINGVSQASLVNSYTQLVNTFTKTASAYKENDFGLSTNGLTAQTDNSGQIPTVTSFSIGSLNSSWSAAGNYLNGTIRRLAYYSVRLTNAQLQALTL